MNNLVLRQNAEVGEERAQLVLEQDVAYIDSLIADMRRVCVMIFSKIMVLCTYY